MSYRTFNEWINEDLNNLICLIEVSREFPKRQVNQLFEKNLIRLLRQTTDPETQKLLEAGIGYDWVGYIASSLRRANISSHSIDALTQDIIVKLLVEPGKLFHGEHGNILARFKTSVRNAIINIVEKRQRRRRRFTHVPTEEMPAALKSEPDDEELIERFRRKIQEELGWVALAVFDARMEGEDTKSLVGQSELDYATSYRVKKIVQQIKSLAREFGDEEFRAMVDRAMDFEKGVMDRRFGIRAPGA